MPSPVGAQVRIEGSRSAIRVEASGASLKEVLAAPHDGFNLGYRTQVALEDSVAGTYQGSLASVASRLLIGYDFVVKISADNIEISVYRRHAPGEKIGPAITGPERPTGSSPPPAMSAREAFQAERQGRR